MPINEPTVLVTRPEHQSTELCQQLISAGFKPISYPTIEILPVQNTQFAVSKSQHFNAYDYLIFVSANAVIQADKLLHIQWPSMQNTVIAIGPKTAAALNEFGISPEITSKKPFNSEQLLEQLPNDLAGKHGCIIKGQGGRTFLSEQLQQRGMVVDIIDVYTRAKPEIETPIAIGSINFITITSQLALKNLFSLLPNRVDEFKQKSTFIVFSQRIANYAKSAGCIHILIAPEASNEGLISTLLKQKKS